jgi:hypothetical protein
VNRGGYLKRTKPMRRRTWLATKAEIRRGKKRLTRRTPLRAKGGSLFPHRRDRAHQAWIRTFPCVVPGCPHPAQCCHVKTQGSGGGDVGNCYPACAWHHVVEQHGLGGIPAFEHQYGLNLRTIAANLGERYRREKAAAA